MEHGYCIECGRLAPLWAGKCERCWKDDFEAGRCDGNPVAAAYHELYTQAIAKLDRLLELKRERKHGE